MRTRTKDRWVVDPLRSGNQGREAREKVTMAFLKSKDFVHRKMVFAMDPGYVKPSKTMTFPVHLIEQTTNVSTAASYPFFETTVQAMSMIQTNTSTGTPSNLHEYQLWLMKSIEKKVDLQMQGLLQAEMRSMAFAGGSGSGGTSRGGYVTGGSGATVTGRWSGGGGGGQTLHNMAHSSSTPKNIVWMDDVHESVLYRQKLVRSRVYELPDGAIIDIDADGNYGITDEKAVNIRRAHWSKQFNPYVNASDLLEEFVKYLASMGVSHSQFRKMPVDTFIAWIIVRAAEKDQEEPQEAETLLLEHHLEDVIYPTCQQCGVRLGELQVSAGARYCSGTHMDIHLDSIRERVPA